MYPIRPLPPLVDMSYGGGPGLSARYPNPTLLTSTRVSYSIFVFALFYLVVNICIGDVTK